MLSCLIADASRLDICAEINVSPRAKLIIPRPPKVDTYQHFLPTPQLSTSSLLTLYPLQIATTATLW
ncbi:hypothetical protein ACN38_g9666 [Penicillium nordicum]|uniref:Uncharacterized protein n=1 Tax=Penicillium nordicum TaxID=229535 RepID=A0A0M8P374_9EURO|nr:hypothetical protein ACN38_g9666 [Penicillium nordicum]